MPWSDIFGTFSSMMQGADTETKFAIGAIFFVLLALGWVFLAYFGGQGLRSLLGGVATMFVKLGEAGVILATGISNSATNVTGGFKSVLEGVGKLIATPSEWVVQQASIALAQIEAESQRNTERGHLTLTKGDASVSIELSGPGANNGLADTVRETTPALGSRFFRQLPGPTVSDDDDVIETSGRPILDLPFLRR